MDITLLQQNSEYQWLIPPTGSMRVPAILYASEQLIRAMDAKVLEQISHVAALPGIETAAYCMPDAHWGYGFPIGGVAAFDADRGGVVSAGGVGFDISCGVRTVLTGLPREQLIPQQKLLADTLFNEIPAGIGSTGSLRLNRQDMDAMLTTGARWAVEQGYGAGEDLQRMEHGGEMADARPETISEQARKRQQNEMGTLGSGNHYLEIQQITDIFDAPTADVFGLRENEIVVSIHCGSRGLGHQVATEYSRSMIQAAHAHGITLPDRELACAPINTPEGQAYLGAMRAAANCALANRQILTQRVRDIFRQLFNTTTLPLLYDVSHNICSLENHAENGNVKALYVHRKGATRALGPGHPELPPEFQATGQPVLVGGTMGTASYILAGTAVNATLAFNSACHGAGRKISRTQALKQWQGKDVIKNLALKNILIRTRSFRGIAEEAPGAYKDVNEVVDTTAQAGLARPVARLAPLICIKG